MFAKEVIVELRKHRLFEFYWDEAIETTLNDESMMTYEPTEYVGYYKLVKEIELPFIGNTCKLKNSVARLTLIFTSSDEHFDIDDAMGKPNGNGVVSAINAIVDVLNEREKILEYRFRLWSEQPEKIKSDTKNIKLLMGVL